MMSMPRQLPCDLHIHPLTLKPWREKYAMAMNATVLASRTHIGRWLSWCHDGYCLDDAVRWTAFCQRQWAEGTQYAFAIFGADEQLLGGVGLSQVDRGDRRANLGYWLGDTAVGFGYATRASTAVCRFGFEHLDLERIEIVAAIGNLSSQRCAERIGARREGIARRRILLADGPNDAVVYGLIRDDLA